MSPFSLLMSSTSSISSSDADIVLDNRREIQPHIRRAMQRFTLFASRLRCTLDGDSTSEEGDAQCVSVHCALEELNESVRDLLRIDQFKTNTVILPSLQLVHAVKELKFDVSSHVDTREVVHILDSLENGVLCTLVQHHMHSGRSANSPRISSLKSSKRSSTAEEILNERSDGVDISFERAKTSSRYCKELAIFVKGRLQLESEHAKKVNALVEQTRLAINDSFLPLRTVFESSFDIELDFASLVKDTIDRLNDRFLKALEARRNEHDNMRRGLKGEWNKELKSLNDTENEEKRAMQTLTQREEQLRKLRRESSRTVKDMEKRRKTEEDAQMKLEDAKRHLECLSIDVVEKKDSLIKTKETTIQKLRELVLQCDQTTKACASHYFKALSSLWLHVPHRLSELAERVREYEPGSEYMAYVQSLQSRTSSITSTRNSTQEDIVATSHRRNAINPQEATDAIEGIRKHKKSTGRLFERIILSDAAKTHNVQRTVQPGKCSHCERVSLLTPLQCTQCGCVYHKACFPHVNEECGKNGRRGTGDRRMSIFGVSLEGHLREEKRDVPFILESTINQIQWRGMRVKGIYRTCGVKSKVEEICEQFERMSTTNIDISTVHPMNLASVVKLYLRKLPVPLLSHDLYEEWKSIGSISSENEQLSSLSRLLSLLPSENRRTLQFVLLHLNRITWFHESNLMCASNLSTVVSPSLIWSSIIPSSETTLSDAYALNQTVRLLIRHAFILFGVDRDADWRQFSALYQMEMPLKEEEDDEDSTEKTVGEIEEEDEEEEEDDDDDIFIPQPPTPDILKSTRNSSPSTSGPLRREKRRSYTTSILVSPHSDSSIHKQQSLDDTILCRRLERKQCDSERRNEGIVLSIDHVGDLFANTDVSYV